MSDLLDPKLWSDLVGLPHEEAGCWHLAREVYRRQGIEIAESVAAYVDSSSWLIVPREMIAPGDLVALGPNGVPVHVAIYLGEGRCLHSSKSGVAVVSLEVLDRSEKIIWIGRPTLESSLTYQSEHEEEAVVLEIRDILSRPFDRLRRVVRVGSTLRDVAPEWANLAITSRGSVSVDKWSETIGAGDVVVFAYSPGEPVTFFVAIAIQILGFVIQAAMTPKPGQEPEEGQPGFSLAGYRNTSLVGIAQPVVYGTHRQGGNILSAFQKTDGDGRSQLHLLLFLSRGPVQAVGDSTVAISDATGSDIPSDLQIDGNEASSYPVRMSTRLGTSDQDLIPGFDEATTATHYGTQLKTSTPFVCETSDEVDAFEVVLTYPVGLYNTVASGSVASTSVVHSISYRLKGSSSWSAATLKTDTFGRRNTVTTLQRFDSLVRGVYEIQITRTTAETETTKSELADINEIAAELIAYTGKALLALRALGSDTIGGSLPTVTAIVKGRKVWVWDGVSTTSPFFSLVWTDNPAWIVAEMLTNKEHGLGRNGQITWNDIDLQSFADWATYCDEIPETGNGKRATCGILVDSTESGWTLVTDIAAAAFCRLVLIGSKIKAVPEKTTTVSAVFSMGNVQELEIAYAGNRSRPNTIEVQYVNAETNYETETAIQSESDTISSGEAIRKESFTARGVTRAIQAHRLAKRRLLAAQLVSRSVSFTVGVEAVHLLPMDVFRLQHDSTGKGSGGRVLTGGTSTVKVDATISSVTGTTCYFRTTSAGADLIVSGTPTATDGATKSTLTFGTPLSTAVAAGDPYAFGVDSTGWPKLFRVESITIEPDLRRRIFATEYVAAVYTDDPGDIESFTDTMPDPRAIPDRPASVLVSEEKHFRGLGSRLRIDWDRSTAWTRVDVWTRASEAAASDWDYQGRFDEAATLDVAAEQLLEISVAPVSAHDGRRRADDGTRVFFYPVGSQYVPAAPSSIHAKTVNAMLHVEIVAPADVSGIAAYEIRVAPGSSSIWAGCPRLATIAGTVADFALSVTSTVYLLARSVSATGVLSATAVSVRVDPVVPTSTYTAAQTVTEAATFTGTKTDTAVSGSALVLDSGDLSGTYVSNSLTTTAQRTFWNVLATLASTERTWDEHAIRWSDSLETWATDYLNGEDCVRDLTWAEAGTTWAGTICSIMPWTGWDDVVSDLTPTIESRINSGSYAQTSTIESTSITQSDLRLTLRRPHTRYAPTVSAIVGQSYTWTAGGGGSGLTHPQVVYRVVIGY